MPTPWVIRDTRRKRAGAYPREAVAPERAPRAFLGVGREGLGFLRGVLLTPGCLGSTKTAHVVDEDREPVHVMPAPPTDEQTAAGAAATPARALDAAFSGRLRHGFAAVFAVHFAFGQGPPVYSSKSTHPSAYRSAPRS